MTDFFMQGHTPLWVVVLTQSMMVILVLVCFWLTLRHIDLHTSVIKKAAIDLMLEHQKINKLIADVVSKDNAERTEALQRAVVSAAEEVTVKAEDAAREVRAKVVTEAEEVREKVDKAAVDARHGFAEGASAVNQKLDIILTGTNADATNKKLDDLLVKSDKPILVEVVNEPLVTRVIESEPKKKK